ncbi:MAG: alpha/beta fold hydrolase [Candidatus Binatia bacterium]
MPNDTQGRLEPVRKHERNVRARTGPLYIRDAGKGEAIVLIHDFPLNSRMWEPQIQALSGHYRLIAPDLTGFGLTPASATEVSLADHAREVLNTINTLGIERVTLAGVSVGGYVALHLVEELGARLQGLLLANIRIAPDDPEAVRWRHELAAEAELAGVEVVADEFLPKMLGSSTQRDHPEFLDLLRLMVRENTPSGVAAMLRAVAARPEPAGFLRRIHCPVLCISGKEDILTSPGETLLTGERIPGALTYTISEAGHLPNLETPEAFNDLLIQFMAESTPA